ncbi:metallophosphoesterase [Qaidamihabitans albus]|uniref:metallophosphoesterase n=1 Tax=Qaidamihabitans albus TaxID=2795733 RepID=UPI0018F20F05|nr:metallophosphoesterase [Qaidamihabitans albus]
MFVVVVFGVVGLLNLYLWKRLVVDTTSRRSRGRRLGTAAMAVLLLLLLAALAFGTRTDPAISQWFAWPGYLWLAMSFYLLLVLLVLELPRLALRRWARRPRDEDTEPPQGVSRRVVLARGSAAIAGVAATGLVGYGTSVAMGPPSITRVPIELDRLDPRAAGCRIALISDIHLGPILGRPFTQRIVDMINDERPDAVAIAGDLVDGSVEDLADAVAPLADLRSTHGTFFVTGNHEYYVGYAQWVEHVRSLGIRALRNERVEITHNGGVFDLAGINDATGYQWQDPGDVGKAVAGRDPGRAVVLIAHQPVDVRDAVRHDVDLMLAGHTHGGQLSPFELAVSLQQGAVAGFYDVEGTKMYVTRGAGFWGPPVRVGAPPDITLVELVSA